MGNRTGLLALILFFLCFSSTAQPAKSDYQKRIGIIQKMIDIYFYDRSTGLYFENNYGEDRKVHSYLWPLCALVQAENEVEKVEQRNDYLPRVMNAIGHYRTNDYPLPGYQATVKGERKGSRFYDDNEWIAIACLDIYQRTKQQVYLKMGESLFDFVMTGQDNLTDGGIYWREDGRDSKNACSNAPAILVALRLYNFTHKPVYLSKALKLYEWINRKLRAKSGLFYDAVLLPSLEVDKRLYAYNSGVMLQVNVVLFKLTKEEKYIKEARTIASALSIEGKNSNFGPDYWFQTVALRGFVELYGVDHKVERFQFIKDEAERVWKNERDANNLLGLKDQKRLIDQSAMMEIYALLEQVSSK
jgi:uncharacterized protein YyaL (SSP411 family)